MKVDLGYGHLCSNGGAAVPGCKGCAEVWRKWRATQPRPRCAFDNCGAFGAVGDYACGVRDGNGHKVLRKKYGADEARRIWARSRDTGLRVQARDRVALYGFLDVSRGVAKFGITGRRVEDRWVEHYHDLGTPLLPIFLTDHAPEHGAVELDLRRAARDAGAVVRGHEWVVPQWLETAYALLEDREDVHHLVRLSEWRADQGGLLMPAQQLWTPR